MEKMDIGENLLVGFGNPLLDISAVVDEAFLGKYNLKENDAIVADGSHAKLYEELEETYPVTYIVGGSVQNTLRVAQWLLRKPKVTTNFGCVGKDKYAKIMYDRTTSDGVNVRYQYDETEPTGTCAVLITGHNRSLCANLASACRFTADHLKKPENEKLLNAAQFYYVSGYFLSVNREAQKEVARVALDRGRPFLLNLSAPAVCRDFPEDIVATLPYVDVLFGNEAEIESLSGSLNFRTENVQEMASKVSRLPKKDESRERMVVVTRGALPVVVAFRGTIATFPVIEIPEENIVDTNGAGDAFVGGFLAQFILGKSVDVCVQCGIWAAAQIIQRNGCSFEGEPDFRLS